MKSGKVEFLIYIDVNINLIWASLQTKPFNCSLYVVTKCSKAKLISPSLNLALNWIQFQSLPAVFVTNVVYFLFRVSPFSLVSFGVFSYISFNNQVNIQRNMAGFWICPKLRVSKWEQEFWLSNTVAEMRCTFSELKQTVQFEQVC